MHKLSHSHRLSNFRFPTHKIVHFKSRDYTGIKTGHKSGIVCERERKSIPYCNPPHSDEQTPQRSGRPVHSWDHCRLSMGCLAGSITRLKTTRDRDSMKPVKQREGKYNYCLLAFLWFWTSLLPIEVNLECLWASMLLILNYMFTLDMLLFNQQGALGSHNRKTSASTPQLMAPRRFVMSDV